MAIKTLWTATIARNLYISSPYLLNQIETFESKAAHFLVGNQVINNYLWVVFDDKYLFYLSGENDLVIDMFGMFHNIIYTYIKSTHQKLTTSNAQMLITLHKLEWYRCEYTEAHIS